MRFSVVILVGALVALLVAPLAWRDSASTEASDASRLVIISPHNEQIRTEIGAGFARWHERVYDAPVVIDWRTPGGTSDIRKLLEAQYAGAVRDGRIPLEGDAPVGALPYDVMLGGGSYEHSRLKRGVSIMLESGEARAPMSMAGDFDQTQLDAWYGENQVGAATLYDPDQHWYGVILSSFGILFNHDVYAELGLTPPQRWSDLNDSRLQGWLALADPRQSGSVATTYDAILNNYGWDEGWRTLRSMAANARYFASSSTLPVLDVSSAEAAAGLCIDFYGRFQAQSVLDADRGTPRLGFVEPAGETLIDPDPVTILRGGPNPELARTFVEFLLSEEGQAVWQFRSVDERTADDEWGPRRFELRRLPIRRVMYEEHFDQFVDRVNPFAVASDVGQGQWRSLIGPILGACAIDMHHDMTEAWRAMHEAMAQGADSAIVAEMDEWFFAMPEHTFPDGTREVITPENARRVAADWSDRERAAEHRLDYMRQFRANYKRIMELGVVFATQ